MNDKVKVTLILGSTRERRRCDTIARWTAAQVLHCRPDFALDVVDPLQLALPPRHEREGSADLGELRRRLDEADAFIVVVPEYNHGYPAALKHLIDSVNEPWRAKPVAFVSYGGMSGGIRAVEQLRQVFAELHATTIRDQVSFTDVWGQFDAGGRLLAPEGAEAALKVTLARLAWWARALRAARRLVPYDEATA